MGVPGLWTVLAPCARSIKLTTLNKRRLAVDASIWIYQFLKAVRDKEGNALRNSHVVGFFRRICKLLFHGIQPVFVFDGGAPALKRETIAGRKRRREGRREDAVRTAGRLLAVQMQRRAEEQAKREREERNKGRRNVVEEEALPDQADLVYVEEIGMTEQERKKNRGFRKKDQYHLPEMGVDFAALGAPNDPRVMSQEELEEYARQFHSGEDINFYDFSKIDFDGPFFQSLPASDRYNILNAARLRSRLRMGYSKEQLDSMFPDRMAFSKFQVARVKERNELTQRLMNLNGMNGEEFNVNGRVAGEKGKEYVLVKNDGVEGGWALGVVSNKNEGKKEQPIDVDRLASSQAKNDEYDESEDEEEWEDVPIEGLNRLPKLPTLQKGFSSTDDLERRKNFYLQRREQAGLVEPAKQEASKPSSKPVPEEQDSLFVQDALEGDNGADELFENVMPGPPDEEDEEDEELQRAIAMSLEQDESEDEQEQNKAAMLNGPDIHKPLDFNEKNAKAGRAFAHATNARANDEVTGPFAGESDGEENTQQPSSDLGGFIRLEELLPPRKPAPDQPQNNGFEGPLPFESLNLGKSMLKRKKKQDEAGGFEKAEEKAGALPPWFSADLEQSNAAQKALEDRDREFNRQETEKRQSVYHQAILHRHQTNEVIDLEALKVQSDEIIEVQSSDEEENVEMVDERPVHTEVRMDDLAEKVQAEPPETEMPKDDTQLPVENETHEDQRDGEEEEKIEWSESDLDNEDERRAKARKARADDQLRTSGNSPPPEFEDVEIAIDTGKGPPKSSSPGFEDADIPPANERKAAASPPPEFEDVAIPEADIQGQDTSLSPLPQGYTLESLPDDEYEYSDPEDEELMLQLAAEAEEHARFASSLAPNLQQYTAKDYEHELKQLRNQQKRDRRDADEVTQVMITECQQLLRYFGLPYITAPMEAEAQCAELVSLGLVDGIVTDDSDIFLFGGTCVYKNMFNQSKVVECYLASDLEKEYSLTREKFIQVAHLLGSDYTEGLPNVGPVTAMELLSEFPSLTDFRQWWESVQSSPPTAKNKNIPAEDAASSFRRKFRKNATKLFLAPNFPDPRVDEAYLNPEVDKDPSKFVWGTVDLDGLRRYLMATVGWSQERVNEILVPVIRDMSRRETEGTQANITRFFGGRVGSGTARPASAGMGLKALTFRSSGAGEDDEEEEGLSEAAAVGVEGFAPRRRVEGKSKRMESALGRLHARAQGRSQGGNGDGQAVANSRKGKKAATEKAKSAKAPTKRKGRNKRAAPSDNDEEGNEPSADGTGRSTTAGSGNDDESEDYAPPKKAAKKGGKVGRGKPTKKAGTKI